MRVACPFLYLVEKFDASIGMASRVVLFSVGVERGIIGGAKVVYQHI
jgi:hypothetical protein